MKQTINDLWNGRINPYNDFANKVLPEIEIKKFLDSHDELRGAVNEGARHELFELIDSIEAIWRKACEEAFEKGFSLGVCLATDSLTEKLTDKK